MVVRTKEITAWLIISCATNAILAYAVGDASTHRREGWVALFAALYLAIAWVNAWILTNHRRLPR